MTQYYIGCKQIVAHEQAHEDGRPGYAVQYPDGYTSWSPKDAFEASYLPMGEGMDPTKINREMVESFIVSHETSRQGNHTVVLFRLRNGFTLIEESACVSADNYDWEIGFNAAYEKAVNRIWNHLGFLLATARNSIARDASKTEGSRAADN